MSIVQKRSIEAASQAAEAMNKFVGAGSRTNMASGILGAGGFAANGGQGGYSTANSATWADITNTSFVLTVSRPTWFVYWIYAAGHISAGAQKGYIRGNIVGFDTSAGLIYDGATVNNGFMWYFPFTAGQLQPANYTVKLQASTDANTTTVTVDQFFHQVFLLGT